MKLRNFEYLLQPIVILVLSAVIVTYTWKTVENFENNTQVLHKKLYDIPFHIERRTTSSLTAVSGVPLIIYQSWHSNKVPIKMKENIYKLLHTNPEFEYYLYSDINSLTFIKDNYPREVTEAFETLKPGAYKSDLWRYCILYITGGVYIDIKFYSIVPLIDIIKKNPIIYVKDMPYSCGSDYGLYNGFMVSPPKNEIFKLCIDDIVNSCKFKLYKSNGLSITGPCLLGEIVRKNESQAYMDALEFNFGYISYVASFWDRTIIRYNDTIIFKVYEEYRNEQKQFQVTEHYGDMWANSMVYN